MQKFARPWMRSLTVRALLSLIFPDGFYFLPVLNIVCLSELCKIGHSWTLLWISEKSFGSAKSAAVSTWNLRAHRATTTFHVDCGWIHLWFENQGPSRDAPLFFLPGNLAEFFIACLHDSSTPDTCFVEVTLSQCKCWRVNLEKAAAISQFSLLKADTMSIVPAELFLSPSWKYVHVHRMLLEAGVVRFCDQGRTIHSLGTEHLLFLFRPCKPGLSDGVMYMSSLSTSWGPPLTPDPPPQPAPPTLTPEQQPQPRVMVSHDHVMGMAFGFVPIVMVLWSRGSTRSFEAGVVVIPGRHRQCPGANFFKPLPVIARICQHLFSVFTIFARLTVCKYKCKCTKRPHIYKM